MTTLDFDSLVLAKGSHKDPNAGMCVMEAVSMLAKVPFTDDPECVCPTIRTFLISWNDSLGDEDRQRLKPYILKVIGTNGGDELALKRSYMVADWFIREYTPTWLELANLKAEAEALRSLPELVDKATFALSDSPIAAARAASRATSLDASLDASRAAVWAAAGAAAWDVSRDAAWVVAGVVAGATSRAAAGDALAPTVARLQLSTFDLLDRMIAVSDGATASLSHELPEAA